MRKSAAKRFVDSLERDLALHREMLEIVRDPEAPAAEMHAANPEPGFTASLCLAARLRGALPSTLADTEHGGGVFEMLESLPADEAARAAELRREFEQVLSALSKRQQAGVSSARPS